MIPQVLVRSFRTNMWKSFSPEAREVREYDVWQGILEVTKAATFDVNSTWKFLWWRFRCERPSFRPDDALKCLACDDGSPVILADDKKVKKIRGDLQTLLHKWYKMRVFSYDGECGLYTFTDDGLELARQSMSGDGAELSTEMTDGPPYADRGPGSGPPVVRAD